MSVRIASVREATSYKSALSFAWLRDLADAWRVLNDIQWRAPWAAPVACISSPAGSPQAGEG